MTIRDAAAMLREWFPPALAEPWDNTGMLLGDPGDSLTSIATCLTLTPEVAEEAIQRHASLIVSHHPIFFRPIKTLTAVGSDAHLYRLARAGVAVYSPHTSFDGATDGINRLWGDRIGLTNLAPLRPAASQALCKLVVYLPEGDLENVQSAVFAAGAGCIGAYSECSFRSAGTGTFRGDDTTNPTVGKPGVREQAPELRLEVIVPHTKLSAAVAAMRTAHSYEEPAFDVIPLRPLDLPIGAGRVGELPEQMELERFANLVARAANAPHWEIVGGADNAPCRRTAIACGAGDDLVDDALRAGCDTFVTGELRFHTMLKAKQAGMRVVLVGHYHSERFAVELLAERLAGQFPGIAIWASQAETPPSVHRSADI